MTVMETVALRDPIRADMELVKRSLAGDASAFEQIYRDLHPRVYRVGRAVTGDDSAARDVVQETFLIVHRKLHTWRAASTIRTWVVRIAIRVACDLRRQDRRRRGVMADGYGSHDPRPALDRSVLKEQVRRLAGAVRGRPGVILRLRLFAGLTNAEIARELRTSEANVRVQLTTAVRRLRTLL